jgi:hypothetical protein
MRECEVAFELGRNLELDHHRVIGEWLDGLDAKWMDGGATMSGRCLRDRNGQAFSAP